LAILCTPKLPAVAAHYEAFAFMFLGLVEWTSFFPRCLDVVLVEKEENR